VHVSVDAPFVFNAKDRAAAKSAPAPVAAELPRDLPAEPSSERLVHLDPVIQPPPPADIKAENHGFFHRVGRFFSAIFR
jgi:hypothetical protein